MPTIGDLTAPGCLPGSLAPALVRVNDVLAARGDDADALVEVLELSRECLGFDRASLIAHIEGSVNGFVIAATDDPDRTQFTITIADYPELVAAIRWSPMRLYMRKTLSTGRSSPLEASARNPAK